MTPREAATIIGCGVRWVRALAAKGVLRSARYPDSSNRYGYRIEIDDEDAVRYRDTVQTVGYPRGRPRS